MSLKIQFVKACLRISGKFLLEHGFVDTIIKERDLQIRLLALIAWKVQDEYCKNSQKRVEQSAATLDFATGILMTL